MAYCHLAYQKSRVGWSAVVPGPPAGTERLAVVCDKYVLRLVLMTLDHNLVRKIQMNCEH